MMEPVFVYKIRDGMGSRQPCKFCGRQNTWRHTNTVTGEVVEDVCRECGKQPLRVNEKQVFVVKTRQNLRNEIGLGQVPSSYFAGMFADPLCTRQIDRNDGAAHEYYVMQTTVPA